MPVRAVLSALTICLLGLLSWQAAVSDQVIMANGDRLTGKILQADRDSVLLQTAYAGTITVERGKVRALHRDAVRSNSEAVEPPDADACAIAGGSASVEEWRMPVTPEENSSLQARAESAGPSAFTPGGKLSGRVNFALSREKGNSEKNEVDFDYQVGYRRGAHRVQSIGTLEFDTDGGDKTTDKWSSYNRYSWHVLSRWYGAVWLALKHDRFADLRLRTLGGPAVGYLAFESETRNLSVEAGPMVLQDDFYGQPDQEFLGPGWLLNYDQLVWGGRLQPYHRQFGYVALDGRAKRLWQSWTGVRVPLAGGVTGSFEFEYDYDSAPAVEAETTDTALRVKLGYQW